jgi:DTW domain-containing protein YfiP
MLARRPPSMPPDPTDACPDCNRPRDTCVCDRTEPLASDHGVLVLQHPREQDVELGSATLVTQSLRGAKRVVGLSWRSLAEAWGASATPSRWAVVFPRSQLAREVAAPSRAPSAGRDPGLYELLGPRGEPIDARRIEGLVVLDGSWSQAKTLWWRNPWLLKLARLTLRPREPSIYGTLRPEPRRDYVSTLEAVGAALTAVGEDPSLEAALRRVFRTLVQRARDARQRRGESPDRARRRPGRARRLKQRRRARAARRR